MKLDKNLREFIELPNSTGVRYLVVGGHAVAFHGHPRYAGDIGFLILKNKRASGRPQDLADLSRLE